MGITLSVNIGVMLYEKKKGRELKSSFLIADSMHTMSDIFVSISVIITLIAIKIGYPMLDAVAAARNHYYNRQNRIQDSKGEFRCVNGCLCH